jgi:dihydroorotate dehydrogenase electron transfer subunit
MEIPRVLKIKSVVEENKNTKTFLFDKTIEAQPGQFVMVWIPKLDEKPFSISYTNPFGITIRKVGPFSEKLFQMNRGEKLGIRGPYGNSFELKGKRVCLISGGYGIIPLILFAENAKKKKPSITSIVGAKTKDDLLFLDRMKKSCSKVIVTTNDGTFGEKGFATDVLESLLKKEKFDCVYTCGPEIMMKKVFDICEEHKIECQASLERYMKCGFGLCGACCLDDVRVCRDGPIFDSQQLSKLSEFGKMKRDKSGSKIYF